VAELGLGKGGINGTKWVVAKFRGYPESSAACRRPYPLYDNTAKQDMIFSRMKTLEEVEKALVANTK
jgi:4-hydroxy-2-oxoglutarate aldolase